MSGYYLFFFFCLRLSRDRSNLSVFIKVRGLGFIGKIPTYTSRIYVTTDTVISGSISIFFKGLKCRTHGFTVVKNRAEHSPFNTGE